MSKPLIGVPVEQDGREAVRYFTDEDAADAVFRPTPAAAAIKLAGVWADLDADEMLERLDRIRHGSTPTPPITSL